MKRILFSLSILMMTMSIFAQIPNKFNYQAVIRNSDGTLRSQGTATVAFLIFDSPEGGAVEFSRAVISICSSSVGPWYINRLFTENT